jgi:hypothetical protein
VRAALYWPQWLAIRCITSGEEEEEEERRRRGRRGESA